jgi:hypothetical protein
MQKRHAVGIAIAFFGLSMLVPAIASAKANPEFFLCEREAGGRYEDSACSVEGARREYGRRAPPGALTFSPLYSASGAAPVIKIPTHTFRCGSYRAKGESSGAINIAEVSIIFAGCKDETTGRNCGTGALHEIATNTLSGQLAYLRRNNRPPAGLILFPKLGRLWARFKCEGGPPEPEYELLGSVIGTVGTTNRAVENNVITYAEVGGAQEYTLIEEEAALGTFQLEIQIVGGARERAVFTAAETQKWPCPHMGVET